MRLCSSRALLVGASQLVFSVEHVWQWQLMASIYLYSRMLSLASGWQFFSMATDGWRCACTQTGWKDCLYGNFQSDISLESQRPQQLQTLTWSQHSRPWKSDCVTRYVYSRRWQPSGALVGPVLMGCTSTSWALATRSSGYASKSSRRLS